MSTVDVSGRRRLERIVEILGAGPRGDGSWYATDCPKCGTRSSLSLTVRGAECRWDGCRWTTCDLRMVLARFLATAGQSPSEIAKVLRKVA